MVRLDLASIEIEAHNDEVASNPAFSFRGLGLDPSRPESGDEDLRWARVELTELRALSAAALSLGQELDSKSVSPTVTPWDAGTPESLDARTVTARANATLDLHRRRTLSTIDLRARFEMPSRQHGSGRATAVEITNTTPLVVSLDAHDIKPQDSTRKPAASVAMVAFSFRAELTQP